MAIFLTKFEQKPESAWTFFAVLMMTMWTTTWLFNENIVIWYNCAHLLYNLLHRTVQYSTLY